MKSSKKIHVSLDHWEGDVLTCYLDPVNIPTIGKGFTNRSKILTEMLGKLIPGKTKITKEQSQAIFAKMLKVEYEPMVNMPNASQNVYDVATSTVWNLGPKSQNWNWAKLWRSGKHKEAYNYLATHYNTAGGKKFSGLVRRRKEEAEICRIGLYPQDYKTGDGIKRIAKPKPPKKPDIVVTEAQTMLVKLGYKIKIDGWLGSKETGKAILDYQKKHPHLVNDGILGKATTAQLFRDINALNDSVGTVGAVSVGVGTTLYLTLNSHWILITGCAISVIVIYFIYKYRDIIQRRINAKLDKNIEV